MVGIECTKCGQLDCVGWPVDEDWECENCGHSRWEEIDEGPDEW